LESAWGGNNDAESGKNGRIETENMVSKRRGIPWRNCEENKTKKRRVEASPSKREEKRENSILFITLQVTNDHKVLVVENERQHIAEITH